jgi:nucleoside-diphosphate-sugar epimerase
VKTKSAAENHPFQNFRVRELPQLAAEAEFIFHLAATVGVELVVKSALHVLESSFHETQILLRAAAKNPRRCC